MEERQATIDGVGHSLSHHFTVFATQNPVEFEGTYPLPEAQLDRFLMKIEVDYPDLDSELKILEDGRTVEIAVIGREGAIGLPSLFSDSHFAPNCTQVSQAGTARRIDVETFEKMLNSDDRLRHRLSHFLDIYIRQISQKAICNMYHSVKERLCTWLLMVQDRCGRTTLNLTHEQVARILGVYRPSITCIAQELREDKLINYSRGGISIVDRRRVEQAACNCYAELGSPVSV